MGTTAVSQLKHPVPSPQRKRQRPFTTKITMAEIKNGKNGRFPIKTPRIHIVT